MRKNKAGVTITICSMALAGVVLTACTGYGGGDSASTGGASACTRATLQKLADTYISAQKAGNASSVPLAANAYYGENDKAVEIGKGILAQPLTVDFTRSFHDTTQCATFTELVAATHSHPYVILTRMEATRDGKVSKMESVVTDQDDWVFGAEQYLQFTQPENWGEIPSDKRDTRAAIQTAAESYINHWGDPSLTVLHGTPCARLEGRIYTGTRDPAANTCAMPAFPQPIKTGNRRYVIDETVGAVVIFHNFSWLDAGLPPDHPGTPAAQMFRVEGGQNRYIHEVTACTTPNCGRGRPGGGPGGGGPAPGAGPGPGPGPGAGPGGA